jgi:transcriptional regulator with XRE-family HTH domain
MTTHKEFMDSLPKKRRKAIEDRAAEILAEEMTLQELRKALNRSQEVTAEALGLKQAAVSRLENRDDMRISTLREYVQALGGDLEFYARFKIKKRGDKARLVRIRNKTPEEHQSVS